MLGHGKTNDCTEGHHRERGSEGKGRTYLFFLSAPRDGNYPIVTGYEFQGPEVRSLDGRRVLGSGRWSYDRHNGQDLKTFRLEVENAIRNPPPRVYPRTR